MMLAFVLLVTVTVLVMTIVMRIMPIRRPMLLVVTLVLSRFPLPLRAQVLVLEVLLQMSSSQLLLAFVLHLV